jgi:hypothetical protein
MDHTFIVAVRPYVQVSTLLLAAILVVQALGVNIDQKIGRFVAQFRVSRSLRDTKGLAE